MHSFAEAAVEHKIYTSSGGATAGSTRFMHSLAKAIAASV